MNSDRLPRRSRLAVATLQLVQLSERMAHYNSLVCYLYDLIISLQTQGSNICLFSPDVSLAFIFVLYSYIAALTFYNHLEKEV